MTSALAWFLGGVHLWAVVPEDAVTYVALVVVFLHVVGVHCVVKPDVLAIVATTTAVHVLILVVSHKV